MRSRTKVILNIIKNGFYSPRKIVNLIKSIVFFKTERVSYFPVFADIESTIACNLNCVMCHRKELLEARKEASMNLEQFKKIIDKLPYLLKLNLQGMGEPLLSSDFFAMVDYARSKHVYVSTVTNGMLMNLEKAQKTVSCGLDRIYFSIDSADSDGYAKYRVNGKLDVVVKNLKNLVDLRNRNKSSLHIGIWMLLFNNNLDQLIPMIKLAKEVGVDELNVQANISYRGKRNWKELIRKMKINSQDNKNNQALEEARAFAKKINLKLSIQTGMGALKPKTNSLCQWPWKSLYIASNGDISSCCIVADPRVAYLGNILEQEFSEIWNGDAYRKLRQSLLKNEVPGYCNECYGK